jgi:hypothetical protein
MHVDTGKTQPEKTHEFVVGASTEWNQDAVFSNRGKVRTLANFNEL